MKEHRSNIYPIILCLVLFCLGIAASGTAAKAAEAGQLETPQGVCVTRKSDKSLRLRWNTVKGASGYVVSRREQGKKSIRK